MLLQWPCVSQLRSLSAQDCGAELEGAVLISLLINKHVFFRICIPQQVFFCMLCTHKLLACLFGT